MELLDPLRTTLHSHAEGSNEVCLWRGFNRKVIEAVNNVSSRIKQGISADVATSIFDILLAWLNQGRSNSNTCIYIKCARFVFYVFL